MTVGNNTMPRFHFGVDEVLLQTMSKWRALVLAGCVGGFSGLAWCDVDQPLPGSDKLDHTFRTVQHRYFDRSLQTPELPVNGLPMNSLPKNGLLANGLFPLPRLMEGDGLLIKPWHGKVCDGFEGNARSEVVTSGKVGFRYWREHLTQFLPIITACPGCLGIITLLQLKTGL